MRAILHALAGAALAVAPACTLASDVGPDNHDPGPWGAIDAGVWYPDAANPCDPPPGADAGFGDPWPDAGPGDPWPDAGDPWPVSDAGPGDPWPDAGDPWPSGCADIAAEAVCIVTPGCNALYDGIDCQCYPDGTCTCDAWEFDHCE